MKLKIKTLNGRLDKAVSILTPYSRTLVNQGIKAGWITVNGAPSKAKYAVQIGDIIEINMPEDQELHYEAENIPLEIVYEDEALAVVNKPQGMVVHPSAGHGSGTLVNALMYHMSSLSSINGVIRPGIVHRIDKDTSGLLMVAKTDSAHEYLAKQLKDKTSKREYLALVHGVITPERGKIEAPIARNPKDRKQQAVVAGGKPAVTHFEVVERFKGYTLLRMRLETGRTHQIRVHMAYIGHPLAGDPLYGPKKTLTPNKGQFLHAGLLGFEHPVSQQSCLFEAPLPDLFAATLERLRQDV